jgi:predicted Fe-Mo cluster-binding NifX family protein
MIKIAVPSRSGMVDEHFGHCESFTVFSVGDDKKVTAQENFTPPPSCGCKSNLVGILKDMGVAVLVGGNMGQGAVVKLSQNGIRVVRGASGPVREAVEAFLAGRLTDRREFCHAHDGCGHGLH